MREFIVIVIEDIGRVTGDDRLLDCLNGMTGLNLMIFG